MALMQRMQWLQLDAISPEIPGSLPIYNIDELMPWATQPESHMMDAMVWLEENAPDLAELCVDPEEDAPPFPGARPILRWSMTAVRLRPAFFPTMAGISHHVCCCLEDKCSLWLAEVVAVQPEGSSC